MKKFLFSISSFLILSMAFISCSKDSSPVQPQNKILTDYIKYQLDSVANYVFDRASTPGMMALISVEGEGDYIIKRGVSNLETSEPMNENAYFRIASNTKPFTGAAVLTLVDDGKINLDSSISFYLPEYNVPNGNRITIRMLGNMTSGLFNYTDAPELWNMLLQSNFLITIIPDTLLAVAFRYPVKFEPGAKYDYCNTNTVLLGLLMEKVTGKPARDVIAEKVLIPLNLKNTYWAGSIFLQEPYCHGYNTDEGKLMDATNWNHSWGYTAEALVSNLWDLKIWAKALAEGQLLSDKMNAERFKWVENYYGFCVMKAGDWVGHPGSITGYNSHVFYNSSKKISLIILTNMDSGSPVEYFSAFFRDILDNVKI